LNEKVFDFHLDICFETLINFSLTDAFDYRLADEINHNG